MKVHELKTHPEPFEAVWIGDKSCEVRVDDRNYKVGDLLHLREYWPPGEGIGKYGHYLSRSLIVRVRHIVDLADWLNAALGPRHVAMSIELLVRCGDPHGPFTDSPF